MATDLLWFQSCGGYDYDFCDPLPDECPCQVCTLVQRDPHQVMCCGKIFCKSCLDELVEMENGCPNCHSNSIKEKNFFPDLNIERKIKHLPIYCKNKKNGCKWIGCLNDLQVHIPKCPNQLVRCTNEKEVLSDIFSWGTFDKCGAEVQLHQLEQHMTQECQWRKVTCKHCNVLDVHQFIMGEHIERCSDIEVPCTNKDCKVVVKRKLLYDHQRECPKAIIPCQYSSIGCKEKIAKDKMETHNQEKMEQHLNITFKALEDVTRRLEALEDHIDNQSDGYNNQYDEYEDYDYDRDIRDEYDYSPQ